ncbi:MAG: hypothetical protein RL536_181 [Candidatus Parcubacteria bacterium]|jgi:hypothetical protein
MVTPELIDYIKTERTKGVIDTIIKANLLSQGWSVADFDEAVALLQKETTSTAGNIPIPRPTGKIITPELKKYRWNRRLLVFAITLFLPMLYILVVYILSIANRSTSLSGLLASTVWYILGGGLVSYISSYIITISMNPSSTKTKEFFNVSLRVVGSIFIALFLALGIFFVSCIVLLSTGGSFL